MNIYRQFPNFILNTGFISFSLISIFITVSKNYLFSCSVSINRSNFHSSYVVDISKIFISKSASALSLLVMRLVSSSPPCI